jgi:hypothetical protein
VSSLYPKTSSYVVHFPMKTTSSFNMKGHRNPPVSFMLWFLWSYSILYREVLGAWAPIKLKLRQRSLSFRVVIDVPAQFPDVSLPEDNSLRHLLDLVENYIRLLHEAPRLSYSTNLLRSSSHSAASNVSRFALSLVASCENVGTICSDQLAY